MGSSLRQLRRQKQRMDAQFARRMDASSQELKMAALYKNGITVADLERERKAGLMDGKKITEDFCFHTIYAAILITMCEKHGWNADDAADLLKEIDQQVVVCIEDKELVNEAFEKTGIQLEWTDPVERIKEG